MGNWPQFSYPKQEIITKLNTWGGNNSPMPYSSGKGGVSGLMPWLRVISAYGCNDPNSSSNGLIMQSNYPEDGFNIRYGDGVTGGSGKSGVCGFELDYKTPVRVKGRPTRPAPIISGLSVSEVDIGRKTTNFSITCYTLEHMEKLAKYFLEPGFYVLVEWGWNTKDARKVWCGDKDTGAITPCMMSQYINVGHVKKLRQQSNYEYDATLGLTTNGSVKFGDNETYILDIELTSQGEVAEYMQGHKGKSTASDKNLSSERFDPAKLDETAEKDGVAKALFRQMFNDLNSEKQTPEIKAWENQNISDKKKDYAFLDWGNPNLDNKWADESNYINMDKEVQTKILSALKEISSVKAGGEEDAVEFEFPEDKPLLSSERFIRFELACAILNEDGTNKSSNGEPASPSPCDKNKGSLIINIDTCICGAHPHMFSTDKSSLFIPNPKAPAFNIDNAFNGTAADVKFIDIANLDSNLQNLHPTPTAGISYTGTREKNGTDTPHAFPSQYELTEEDNKWKDEDIKSYECPSGYWGWLKNLYINFDFFCQVMKTPNYTIRDVLYDLLNGMSSAVNSHWRFQIVERHHPNSELTELQVVDLNFSGVINHTREIPTFQLRGTTSPFIEVDFNVTTPAAMQNSILQKRASNDIKASTAPEFGGLIPVAGSVWSSPNSKDKDGIVPFDPVATIVSGVYYKEPTEENNETTATKKEEKDADAIRNANYQFFVGKAGVFPKNQNRNDMEGVIKNIDEGNIKEVFMVGTFNDSALLRQVYLKDIDSEGWREPSNPNYGKVNVPFGMAEVNFTVHGMSGFKRGDTMRFEGLPKNFSYPHTYEVTGLEHELTTTGWFTKVKTGMRPYGANTAAK